MAEVAAVQDSEKRKGKEQEELVRIRRDQRRLKREVLKIPAHNVICS